MEGENQFQKLAHDLKEICNRGKETEANLDKTTDILYQLGKLYQEESPDKISLIRSAAFYNAAIVRRPEKEMYQEALHDLCFQILKVSVAENKKENLCQFSNDVMVEIDEMRNKVNESLLEISKISVGLPAEELFVLEKEKIAKIQALQSEIAEKFTAIMNCISQKCIDIMGKPPCRYSLTGMGSLARKEITPYSDFEHIIVLEEGVQEEKDFEEILEYFRWYSVIFHIIVINFKESIVRSVASPYLNDDLLPGGDWFFDAFTTCGIKFDGMQIHACKFPLGRFRTTETISWTTELIQPISKMARFLEVEEEEKNGFHLGDVLTKTCFVSGCRAIHDEFQQRVTAILESREVTSQSEILKQLAENLTAFNPLMRIALTNAANYCDIKRVLYRTTTLFVSALGRLAKINKSSSFEIVDVMHERHLLSYETAHKLLYGIAVACEVRLRVYMSKKGQDDFYGERDYDHNERKLLTQIIDLIGEESLSEYMIIAHSLHKAINKNNIKDLYNIACDDYDKLMVLWMFDLHNRFDYEWQEHFQNKCLKIESGENILVLYTVAKMNLRRDKFDEALDIFQLVDNSFEKALELKTEARETALIIPIILADSMKEKTQCLVRLNRCEDALVYIRQAKQKLQTLALSNDDLTFDLASLVFLEAQSQEGLEQFQEAISSFGEAIGYFNRTVNPHKRNFVVRSHIGIAVNHFKTGNLDQIIENLKIAVKLHYDSTIEVSLIANCCRALYENLLVVNQPEEAEHYLEKELALRLQYISAEDQGSDEDIQYCRQKLNKLEM